MESRGISAERAEFLNVASWTNVKSREIYCYTHQQNFCTALLSYVPARRRWVRHHQFLPLDNFSDKLLKQTSHRLGSSFFGRLVGLPFFVFDKKWTKRDQQHVNIIMSISYYAIPKMLYFSDWNLENLSFLFCTQIAFPIFFLSVLFCTSFF